MGLFMPKAPKKYSSREKSFTYMILICIMMVIFITLMDIFGANMFLSLGEARHATYATISSQYLTFFWVFTIAMVFFSSAVYFILRRRILETIAVFIAQLLFVLSGLEDILFYAFQGIRLASVDLSHLNNAPAGIVTRMLGFQNITPNLLIANVVLFCGLGILLLGFLAQEYEGVKIQKLASISVTLLLLGIAAIIGSTYFGIDLATPLDEKVTLATEEFIGCKGAIIEGETFRVEHYGTDVICAVYARNSGYVNIDGLEVRMTDRESNKLGEVGDLRIRTDDLAGNVQLIETGQRILIDFKISGEMFNNSYYAAITPIVEGELCQENILWLSRVDWEVTYP